MHVLGPYAFGRARGAMQAYLRHPQQSIRMESGRMAAAAARRLPRAGLTSQLDWRFSPRRTSAIGAR